MFLDKQWKSRVLDPIDSYCVVYHNIFSVPPKKMSYRCRMTWVTDFFWMNYPFNRRHANTFLALKSTNCTLKCQNRQNQKRKKHSPEWGPVSSCLPEVKGLPEHFFHSSHLSRILSTEMAVLMTNPEKQGQCYPRILFLT